jgi:teichuronic acid biosynthesis glycosyltransferase TuaC
MRRARVAVITTSWPREAGDPAGHFVRAEARALERSGHDVVVVAPPAGGAFGWPGVATRVRERPARVLEATSWVLRARAQVRRLAAERVVAHWAVPCAWPIAAAARDAGLEVVSHGGDVRLLISLPPMARRLLVDRIAAHAERWRFVSDSLLESLLRALDHEAGARVARIAYVEPVRLELPDVGRAVAQRRRALGAMRVGVSVARLVPSKRVDRVIDHVAQTRDVDTLVVVGEGPERRRLERLARARGVCARFVGMLPREDALAWIGAADALLHASEAEGASTVVREAEALGTRVVRVGRF